MELIKAPSPMRLLCGGSLAYWLSGIINPAFVTIAVMIVLFIPVFIVVPFFPDPPAEEDQEKVVDNQSD